MGQRGGGGGEGGRGTCAAGTTGAGTSSSELESKSTVKVWCTCWPPTVTLTAARRACLGGRAAGRDFGPHSYMIQPLVELYGGCMVVLKVS
jgi:hypothetical protein